MSDFGYILGAFAVLILNFLVTHAFFATFGGWGIILAILISALVGAGIGAIHNKLL